MEVPTVLGTIPGVMFNHMFPDWCGCGLRVPCVGNGQRTHTVLSVRTTHLATCMNLHVS